MQTLKINNLFSIKKKICVVSGAGGGLGKIITKSLLLNGATVVALDKKKISINLKNLDKIKIDLEDKKQIEKLKLFIKKKYKKIDSIINLCGISDPKNFEKNIRSNLYAPFNLINGLNQLIKKKSGTIVNITSLNAELGYSNNPGYNSSKGGLKMLSKSMAIDYSHRNIRVNNIGPGYFLTEMTKKFYKIKSKRLLRLSRIPMKRYGKPEELCGAIIFFISDASSYITGQDLYVDGGLLHKGI